MKRIHQRHLKKKLLDVTISRWQRRLPLIVLMVLSAISTSGITNLLMQNFITLSGQVSIRWIENKMNQKINKILKTEDVDYVIASDTDSIYLNLGPLVERVYEGREKTNEGVVGFLNKVCETEFEAFY